MLFLTCNTHKSESILIHEVAHSVMNIGFNDPMMVCPPLLFLLISVHNTTTVSFCVCLSALLMPFRFVKRPPVHVVYVVHIQVYTLDRGIGSCVVFSCWFFCSSVRLGVMY